MNTTEKLQKIKSECQRLLALAKKRTPGDWIRPHQFATHLVCAKSKNLGSLVCDFPDSTPDLSQHSGDADFVAACAGPAEAGWLATIAAIDLLVSVDLYILPGSSAADLRDAIIRQWNDCIDNRTA